MVPGQSRQRPQGASGCFYLLPGLRTAHPECNQPKNRNRQKSFPMHRNGAPANFSSGTHTFCKASAAASGPNDPEPVHTAQNIFALGPEQNKTQFPFSEILEISRKPCLQGQSSAISSLNSVLGHKEGSDDFGNARNQFYVQNSRHCSFLILFLTFPFLAIPDTRTNISRVKYHNFYAGTLIRSQLAVFTKIEHIRDPGKSSKIIIFHPKRAVTTP